MNMYQVMAECDCSQEGLCLAARCCLAETKKPSGYAADKPSGYAADKPSGYAANLPARRVVHVPVISGTFSTNIQAVPVTVPCEPWGLGGTDE